MQIEKIKCIGERGGFQIYDLGIKKHGYIKAIFENSEEVLDFYYAPYLDTFRIKGIFRKQSDGYFCSEKIISFRYLFVRENYSVRAVLLMSTMRKVKKRGDFKCSDPLLNDIFQVAAYTVKLCMMPNQAAIKHKYYDEETVKKIDQWTGVRDNYVLMDGCRRDREVWVGDLLPEIRVAYYLFADRGIILNSLLQIAEQMNDDGWIPASGISRQDYTEYICDFFLLCKEYFLLTGDKRFFREIFPKLKKIFSYLMKKVNEQGVFVLAKKQTWAWTMKREGAVTCSNCIWYEAIGCYTFFCSLAQEDTNELDRLREKVKKYILENSYEEKTGLFLDVAGKAGVYSLDANVNAVNCGLVKGKTAKKVLKESYVKFANPYGSILMQPKEVADGQNWLHNDNVWPFLVCYQIEAEFKTGNIERGIFLAKKCFGNMLHCGADSFWETADGNTGKFLDQKLCQCDDEDVDVYDSAAHGWSGGIAYLFMRYVLGVFPMSAGFCDVQICPSIGKLKFLEGKVPTPFGTIFLRIEKKEKELAVSGRAPEKIRLWNKKKRIFCMNGKFQFSI